MASTFAELYGDFRDQVTLYTEKLSVTEIQFMRWVTQGMQKFQQETKYIERAVTIPRDTTDDVFPIPNDFLEFIEAKDLEGYTFVPQGYEQYTRNLELHADDNAFVETSTDYMMRLQEYYSRNTKSAYARYICIFARFFKVYPNPEEDDNIYLWYIPDIPPISRSDGNWTTWFTGGVFNRALFLTSMPNRSISPYEECFVDYAISKYLKAMGHPNYRVFEKSFQAEVARAKMNKPTMASEMTRDYMFAPYS